MTDVTCLIFGAPKFKEFAIDLGNEMVDRGLCDSLAAVCTGGSAVVDFLKDGLGERLRRVYDVEAYEPEWVAGDAASEWLQKLENELGIGAIGDVITSDRRIGRGFVTGGVPRPDPIGRRAYADPLTVPETYVSGLYQYLDGCLRETQPRFVFAYAVAGAPAYLAGLICLARGIPFLRLTPARIGNRYLVDDDLRSQMAPVARQLEREGRDKAESEVRPEVRDLLDRFRKAPEPPEYSKRNQRLLQKSGISRAVWRATRTTVGTAMRRSKGNPRVGAAARRAWFNVVPAVRRRLIPTKLFADTVPGGYRWFYFPLHVDPEASTMVAAPDYTNQLAVVEAIAKALPVGARLVVKEHLPMLGKRPKGFYAAIARMPRVVLVGPEREGVWWLRNSSVTVTITGTAGWEAVQLGKPAVFIGESPFTQLGEGVIQEGDLTQLPEALHRALNKPGVADSRLYALTDALYGVSFELNTSLLWGQYYGHSPDDRRRAITAVTDGIEARLSEVET